jgi:hypothetical protein
MLETDIQGHLEKKKVPEEGLEPPRVAALGSKPSVSANSTTPALVHSYNQ